MKNSGKIKGQLIAIKERRIYPAEIIWTDGIIVSVNELSEPTDGPYICPGFIDSHVHIESSLLIPSEFARMAVVHGTIATISDPHEIANVLGIPGVEFMIKNGNKSPLKFFFGAPSCVPATPFETAGAVFGLDETRYLLEKPEIHYLAEMMNWPGVLHKDKSVLAKIELAQQLGKPIDGHAPGLLGEEAKQYYSAGISTDHECFTEAEALGKLKLGMKILIREGSAAKNFEALSPLIPDHYKMMMFCSDDKHPDSLQLGHINQLIARGQEKGYDLFHLLQMACINPVEHYQLPTGLLRINDPADFLLLDSIDSLSVQSSYIDGCLVSDNGKSHLSSIASDSPNKFEATVITTEHIQIQSDHPELPVIEVIDGELITNCLFVEPTRKNGYLVSDINKDLLKMIVLNRYQANVPPSVCFIKNFGLKEGAIGSSVAHDSHNVIVVGVDDVSIVKACNMIIQSGGGLSAVNAIETEILPLPVAGLMSTNDAWEVASNYTKLDLMAKNMGSRLLSPYMSLSFMALLVIPNLKLSDKGLFDGKQFKFVDWQGSSL